MTLLVEFLSVFSRRIYKSAIRWETWYYSRNVSSSNLCILKRQHESSNAYFQLFHGKVLYHLIITNFFKIQLVFFPILDGKFLARRSGGTFSPFYIRN
jgi:hypothetical protein